MSPQFIAEAHFPTRLADNGLVAHRPAVPALCLSAVQCPAHLCLQAALFVFLGFMLLRFRYRLSSWSEQKTDRLYRAGSAFTGFHSKRKAAASPCALPPSGENSYSLKNSLQRHGMLRASGQRHFTPSNRLRGPLKAKKNTLGAFPKRTVSRPWPHGLARHDYWGHGPSLPKKLSPYLIPNS